MDRRFAASPRFASASAEAVAEGWANRLRGA